MAEKRKKTKYVIGITLIVILLIDLLPYLWLLISSFRASDDPFTSSVLPSHYTFQNYTNIFQSEDMLRPFFSRYYFKGREFILSFLVNLRTFPALLLAIALYVMAVKTGLYNTYVPLILANTMMNLPFAIWNVKTVMDGIPRDLEESALVDGLSRTSVIWKIIVPVATPGLAATGIYVFILTWNEYLFATTFMNSNEMQLVTSVIASAVTQFGVDYGWLMTTAMLASVPAIIMFIAIQKFIVGGLTAGGVKG